MCKAQILERSEEIDMMDHKRSNDADQKDHEMSKDADHKYHIRRLKKPSITDIEHFRSKQCSS